MFLLDRVDQFMQKFVDEIHSQHVVKRQVQRPVMPHKGTLQINQKKKEIKEKRKRKRKRK